MRLNRVLITLAVFFSCCPLAVADGVRGLQEIYGTPIPAQIRKNFDQVTETHRTCPACALGVLDGEKFFDIYTKKFLVVGMSPDSFGGWWAVIAVEGEPRNAFRLWLYDVGDDAYELRSIEELPRSLDAKLIHQLWSPDYGRYWL